MKQLFTLFSAVCCIAALVNAQCPIANAGPDQGGCTTSSYTIGTAAVPGYTYSWSPTTGLSNPNIAQPTAI